MQTNHMWYKDYDWYTLILSGAQLIVLKEDNFFIELTTQFKKQINLIK